MRDREPPAQRPRAQPRARLGTARGPDLGGPDPGAGPAAGGAAGSGAERRAPAAAMGLCCCKDWRGHLPAPKGNSRERTCAAGSFQLLLGDARPASGTCPPLLQGCPPPASALERVQVWLQLPESLQTSERASRWSSCSTEPGWGLGPGPPGGRGGERSRGGAPAL